MHKHCPICGRATRTDAAIYCHFGCAKLASRAHAVDDPHVAALRMKAVKEAWQDGYFRCHYTGVKLHIDDPSSPFYLTFDRLRARGGSKIVACAAFVHDVKSDSTDEEFRHNIVMLCDHFRVGRPLAPADFRLSHYKRHRPNAASV